MRQCTPPSSRATSLKVMNVGELDSVELDIADAGKERPTSRLGFNRALHQPLSKLPIINNAEYNEHHNEEHRTTAETLSWTRTLSHKIGGTTVVSTTAPSTLGEETDITTAPTYEHTLLPSISTLSSSSNSLDDLFIDDEHLSLSSNSDSDRSSDGEEDEFEFQLVCAADRTLASLNFPNSPARSTLSCSAQSPTHAPIAVPARTKSTPPTPPTRTPYSCIPSPLSPNHIRPLPAPTALPFPLFTSPHNYNRTFTPPRHNYVHRGVSQHALHQLKWFWSIRHDDWACRIYDGVRDEDDVIESARTSPSPQFSSAGKPPPPSTPPPLSMYPRAGDLSALHDPYSVQIDRCFWAHPLWTLRKTLFMYDVHLAADRWVWMRERGSSGWVDEGEGEGEMEGEDGYQSSSESLVLSTSDLSEVTLVDSECDIEAGEGQSGADVDGEHIGEEEEDGVLYDVTACLVEDDADGEESDASCSPDNPFTNPHYISKPRSTIDSYLSAPPTPKPHQTATSTALGLPRTSTPSPQYLGKQPQKQEHASARLHRPWEVSWSVKWELLVELVRRDQERVRERERLVREGEGRHHWERQEEADIHSHRHSDSACAADILTSATTAPTEKLDADDEFWAEEEEDYGVLVSNPVFGRVGAF